MQTLSLALCQGIIYHGDMFLKSNALLGEVTLILDFHLELGQASTLLTINAPGDSASIVHLR